MASVLILSWEYPPIVEGGLARHVRKLSEGLVAHDVAVHVLTRGREGDVPEEVRAGVRVHRMPEPATPRDLDEFVAWVEGMNEHMLAAGRALTDRYDFDVIHGHDWLVARAAAGLARASRRPYLTTVLIQDPPPEADVATPVRARRSRAHRSGGAATCR